MRISLFNVAFTNEVPWRLPDAFEINDALQTVRQLGGTVVRTGVITVSRVEISHPALTQ